MSKVTTGQATKIAQHMFMMICDGRGDDKVCYPIGYLASGNEDEATEEMVELIRHYEGFIRNPQLTTLIGVMRENESGNVVILWNDSQHLRYWSN